MPGQRAVNGGVGAALPADWLVPDWPAPAGVQALCTTRAGGVSQGPYASMNLGTHVGDDPQAVQTNRARLQAALGQSTPGARPVFLSQVHGTGVAALTASTPDNTEADACVATDAGVVCTIMVADCLPVLLAHTSGAVVGAAHAGWRGLAGQSGVGVLESAMRALFERFQALLANSSDGNRRTSVNDDFDVRHLSSASLVWCLKSKHQIMVLAARATDAKMVSALLCHTNGLGSSL